MIAKLNCLVLGGGLVAWTLIATSPCTAQDARDPLNQAVDPVQVSVGNGGMQRNVPGRWAILSVAGRNPTDRDVEETMVVTVGDQTNLQYARQLWIPAGARRSSRLPIQIPGGLPVEQHQMEIRSTRLRRDVDGSEQYVANAIGEPETSVMLLLSEEESRAAVIFDNPDPSDTAAAEEIEAVAKTIDVVRERKLISTRRLGLIRINDHFLPSNPVGLDALDQLILAGDRVLEDSMSPSLIVRWVQAGGQLWVMLDRMDPTVVQTLLGELANHTVVDRVELNDFTLSATQADHSFGTITSVDWSDEMPVDMVRVVQDSGEVVADIDGWPAVFRRQLGLGTIMFSTVGARGWLMDEQPLLVLDSVGRQFFGRRPAPVPSSDAMASLVDADIGYQIPSRGMVTGILGSHLVLVIAAGIWLFQRQQLQWLAAVVPAASALAAVVLIGLGKQQVNAIDAIVATTQVVQSLPGSNQVQIQSMTAVFTPQERELEVVSSGDTSSMLVEAVDDAALKRNVWDDSGRSRWNFVRQPPGVVRHITSHRVVEVAQPWSAEGTFDAQGFAATITGLDGQRIEDAIAVASPAPNLALTRDGAANEESSAGHTGASRTHSKPLRGGVDDVLPQDQYVNAGIVSETQRDRQNYLRQIMASDSAPFGSASSGFAPTVLAWTDLIDSGLSFRGDFAQQGSALVSIPIVWKRPEPGSSFQVPASFVKIRPHQSTRGTTTLLNERDGQWLELNEPRDAEIRCEVPAVLLPCKLAQAKVEIRISAPSRTLDVKARTKGEFVSVHQEKNPNGVVRFTVEDARQLDVDESGGWVLMISVSASDAEKRLEVEAAGEPLVRSDASPDRNFWKIESMQVQYEGITL